jgi:PGF-pre-PGF domain-containing protein
VARNLEINNEAGEYMKGKEKIHSITLALTSLVFLIFVLSTVQPVHGQLILTETRITTDESLKPTNPDIEGDRIIWMDKRNGNYDIYMYNISTSNETQITSDITSQLWPKIYGDRIAWQDERNGDYDIYMYNTATSTETRITNDSSDQKSPVIYGDRIVWTDSRNGNRDIYMYNTSTSTETRITMNGADQYASALYGDRVVAVDGRNGNFDLYLYNLSTLTETRITTNEADQYSPAIYGDRIVWLDYRDGVSGYMDYGDIYMYDLSAPTEVKLDTGAEDPQSLAIYGDRIIYIDNRGGKEDLYMYDLSDSTETQITNNGRCIWSAIYGNRIVWETYHYDNANYISEIYMSTVSELEAPSSPYAYITNYGDNTTSVIDTSDNTVVATVPVGSGPEGVAVTSDGSKVYVANNGNGIVSVINTSTNTVTDTMQIGSYPVGVAVNPEGTKVYMANSGNGNISVIDTATGDVTANIYLGAVPVGVAVNPEGTKVYVAKIDSNMVSVIDTATNNVTTTVPVGNFPFGVAVNPAGTRVYVTTFSSNGFGSNAVSVIDTATNNVTATVPVGPNSYGIAVNPAGTKVYVTNGASNTVSVIDSATNTITATVPVGSFPYGVSVTPDGKKVYVANYGSNNVSVIDTATNTVTGTVNVGNNPIAFGQFIASIPEQIVLPVPNFSASATSGYAPLSVQFTDSSQNAEGWNWAFGDGTTSTGQNPAHIYSAAGTYTVRLTVSNGNNVASKTATITVLASNSDDDDESSSGGSHHSSSGGGGGGGSPEPAKNVEVKELCQVFITNGKAVQFDFTKNATCVVYVGFDAKKTVGKTTSIVEQLKNKSTLVSNLTEGDVYKYFNVWVGNSGFASSENIENPTICFKVEKSWLQENNVAQDSITLNRYSDKTWTQLPASLLKEDDKYLYFKSNVSGYSFFAITGKQIAEKTIVKVQPESQTQGPEEKTGNTSGNAAGAEQETEQEENKSIPGFLMIYGIASLFVLYLYKRK